MLFQMCPLGYLLLYEVVIQFMYIIIYSVLYYIHVFPYGSYKLVLSCCLVYVCVNLFCLFVCFGVLNLKYFLVTQINNVFP